MRESCDLVIAGGGPVGGFLALALNDQGDRGVRGAGDEVHRGAFHAGRLGERFLDVRLTRRANHSVNLKGDRLRRH